MTEEIDYKEVYELQLHNLNYYLSSHRKNAFTAVMEDDLEQAKFHVISYHALNPIYEELKEVQEQGSNFVEYWKNMLSTHAKEG